MYGRFVRIEQKLIQSIFSFVNYGNSLQLWFKIFYLGNISIFLKLFFQEKEVKKTWLKYKEKLCPSKYNFFPEEEINFKNVSKSSYWIGKCYIYIEKKDMKDNYLIKAESEWIMEIN